MWAAGLAGWLLCSTVQGQVTRDERQVAGLPQNRPVVPLAEPRAAEGSDAQDRWKTNREGKDGRPMASFVESYKASDATLEVIVGQGRLLTTKRPLARDNGQAVAATADPTVLDFEILPTNPRMPQMLRLTGKRAGVTDFTIVTDEGETYVFEVHVVYDLALAQAQLCQLFPDALIKLSQLREHVVLEGQARTAAQASQIEQTLRLFLSSVQVTSSQKGAQPVTAQGAGRAVRPPPPGNGEADKGEREPADGGPAQEPRLAGPEAGNRPSTSATFPQPQVVNLLQVVGLQQVMLQVRVAELNRTGLREIGADIFLKTDAATLGTNMAGALGIGTLGGLTPGPKTTAFGIFPSTRIDLMLRALRENKLLSILAEPNLIALNGQDASFLAGGEFPVPVQQGFGGAGNVQVQWKQFGVLLHFVPFILDHGTIRLRVAPEVSTIDEAIGTTLVQGGEPIPGVNTRRVTTTVELQEGQTLVLAGLLQVQLEAQTARIPGLGDLPYLGPMFSNTSHSRVEKELLVLVTPYLVSPLESNEVPRLPGADIQDPNDLEFYLLNRIEGRRGRAFRTTTAWEDPWHLVPLLHLERDHLYGPVGLTE
jgi:pilus assembly protein CpaC